MSDTNDVRDKSLFEYELETLELVRDSCLGMYRGDNMRAQMGVMNNRGKPSFFVVTETGTYLVSVDKISTATAARVPVKPT